MEQEFTIKGMYEKLQEQNIFENVFLSFVITKEGRMFEKITDGIYQV